nr:hypothetical protein L203_04963 [Cryptococcus depauperatus CBS 7841]
MSTLWWPAQSSDLNSIEHLWDYLKKELRREENEPQGMLELWERIEKVWDEIPVSFCGSLIESMPRRYLASIFDSYRCNRSEVISDPKQNKKTLKHFDAHCISPLRALTGYEPSLPLFDLDAPRLRQLHKYLQTRLSQQQVNWQKHDSRKRSPVPFKVGDVVLSSTKNLRTVRPSKKLENRWIGPFEILKQINENAFRLKLPRQMRIHPVLPATPFRRYVERENGDTSANAHIPANITNPVSTVPSENDNLPVITVPRLPEIEVVIDERSSTENTKEFLIKWLRKPPTDNSWISLQQAQ